MKQEIKIDWKRPPMRKGFSGLIDVLAGPGATQAELILQFGLAFLAAVVMFYYSTQSGWNWTGWQIFVATYLAFDICGGIATNATSTAKRWWHREKRRHFRNDAKFIAAHFYMPLLITLAFIPGDWSFFWINYLSLLVMASAISLSPLYLKRPVAFIMFVAALLLSMYHLTHLLPQGMIWYPYFFYLKLLMSHLPLESPFRP